MRTTGIVLLVSSALNLVAAAFVATGFSGQASPKSEDGTLRIRKLELVDSQGEICGILAGNDNLGGTLTLYRPGMKVKEGRPPVVAFLGCVFPSLSLFYLKDGVTGERAATIKVDAKTMHPELRSQVSFTGGSDYGSFEIHAGRQSEKLPCLQIKKIKNGEEDVVFER